MQPAAGNVLSRRRPNVGGSRACFLLLTVPSIIGLLRLLLGGSRRAEGAPANYRRAPAPAAPPAASTQPPPHPGLAAPGIWQGVSNEQKPENTQIQSMWQRAGPRRRGCVG